MKRKFRFYKIICFGTLRPYTTIAKVGYIHFYTRTKRYAIKETQKYFEDIQHEHVRITSIKRVRYGHFFQRYKWYWKLKTLRLEIKKELVGSLRRDVGLLGALFIHKSSHL